VDCLNALEAVDNTEGTDDGESRDGNQQTPEEDCAVDGKESKSALHCTTEPNTYPGY